MINIHVISQLCNRQFSPGVNNMLKTTKKMFTITSFTTRSSRA
jgi:hypothetical protein